MNSLEEKLREIVDYCAESYYPEHEYGGVHRDRNQEYCKDAVKQIIQAFKDDGWVKPNRQPGVHGVRIVEVPTVFMTGQEWYSRFEKELDLPSREEDLSNTTVLLYHPEVIRAAKRASGVEE